MDAVPAGKAVPSAASVQRKEAYTPLAEFTLALIQAMLRTGYYAPDHPEAQRAVTGLYEQFRNLLEGRAELTYLILEKQESQEIAVEGYTNIHLPLYQVMIKGMADLFTPKFLEFFKRWNLLSFSIKADVTETEFNTFIELMSQPPTGGGKDVVERLTRAFVERQVMRISTVFRHEMVGRERRLPWRVRLALTRLRRDLRVLPLYKRASPEQLRQIKLQIIDDVIRPVRTPALLKDFLVNYDLIAADISVLDESSVEQEIVANCSDELLVGTSQAIIENLQAIREHPERVGGDEDAAHIIARHVSALRDIANQLCAMGSSLDHDFIEALVDQNVLTLEELPLEVRQAVETRHLADAFIVRKDQYLQYLRQPSHGEATQKLAATVIRIAPDLLRRSKYALLDEIIQVVRAGRADTQANRFFQQLSELMVRSMSHGPTLRFTVNDLERQDKESRKLLVGILAFIGDGVAPRLLELYAESDDKAVRLSAYEALRDIGPSALQPFLSRLPSLNEEWPAIHHILGELGELGEASLAQPITGFLYHSNAHVRNASLTALFKLQGAAAEEHFLHALRDDISEVRQAAVSYLAAIGSRHPQALEFYTHALDPEDGKVVDSDGVLLEVCRALAGFAHHSPDDARTALEILQRGIRPVKAKGPLGLLKKPAPRHSEAVQAAIWEALSALGQEAPIATD